MEHWPEHCAWGVPPVLVSWHVKVVVLQLYILGAGVVLGVVGGDGDGDGDGEGDGGGVGFWQLLHTSWNEPQPDSVGEQGTHCLVVVLDELLVRHLYLSSGGAWQLEQAVVLSVHCVDEPREHVWHVYVDVLQMYVSGVGKQCSWHVVMLA